MPCNIKKLPGGGGAIVCSRTKVNQCYYCGRPANLLCDLVVETGERRGNTCDRPICPQCSVPVGPNKDYCKIHGEQK